MGGSVPGTSAAIPARIVSTLEESRESGACVSSPTVWTIQAIAASWSSSRVESSSTLRSR